MADRSFPLTPRDVPPVHTAWRRIHPPLPVPESLPTLEALRRHEPRSMSGQPPVVWDHASGVQVHDAWGNTWLDFSSGVLVTNAGHSHPAVVEAIVEQARHGLLHNYCFPSQIRAQLAEALTDLAPSPLSKVFLLTTGAEATECAIKLMRTWGVAHGGPAKHTIVTFDNAFHGRTLGAQQAGGMAAPKSWIVNLDPGFVQVPFPDGFRCPDVSFDHFLASLDALGLTPDRIAGVMAETYQGVNACLAPPAYFQAMRRWADEHDVLITFDEVQAGFGRTGRWFGFEHYGMLPDLACCGKGLGDGLPISAVLGRPDVMDQYPPGSMTSTHTGNPISCAAALASLNALRDEDLVGNAARLGPALLEALEPLRTRFAPHIGVIQGVGLVAAVQFTQPGTTEPDPDLAFEVTLRCIEKGLLLFAPVGVGGCAIKLNPPLCIGHDALLEGVAVLEEALTEVLG